MPDEIKKSPDEWALQKFGVPETDPKKPAGSLKLDGVPLLLLAGMKVHAGRNAVGDTMTEAEFDAAWAEFASLPVGR